MRKIRGFSSDQTGPTQRGFSGQQRPVQRVFPQFVKKVQENLWYTIMDFLNNICIAPSFLPGQVTWPPQLHLNAFCPLPDWHVKKSSPVHSLFTQIFKFQYSLIQNIVTDLDSNFTLDHINDLDRVWHRPRGVPYGHHGHNPSIFSHRSDDIKKPTSLTTTLISH